MKKEKESLMTRHTGMEDELNINDSIYEHDHVIIDKEDWEEVRKLLSIHLSTEEEIKKAASEWEKQQCNDADHPFLKEYVNEDFVAGANWAINFINKDKPDETTKKQI